MNVPRYKIIVQVTIGELKDQGIRVASRCLWDVSTDNYTSVSYTNVSSYRLNYDIQKIESNIIFVFIYLQQSLFCSVLVFALYCD